VPISLRQIGIRSARRRGMDGVKRREETGIERQRISLNEFKWVVRLRFDVHPDYAESRSAVTFACPARAAEKIKQPSLRHSSLRPLSLMVILRIINTTGYRDSP
jgi:hypothetical protein